MINYLWPACLLCKTWWHSCLLLNSGKLSCWSLALLCIEISLISWSLTEEFLVLHLAQPSGFISALKKSPRLPFSTYVTFHYLSGRSVSFSMHLLSLVLHVCHADSNTEKCISLTLSLFCPTNNWTSELFLFSSLSSPFTHSSLCWTCCPGTSLPPLAAGASFHMSWICMIILKEIQPLVSLPHVHIIFVSLSHSLCISFLQSVFIVCLSCASCAII